MKDIKYFKKSDLTTIESFKKAYHKLCFKYHSDINPNINPNIMKNINNEYEKLLKIVIKNHNLKNDKKINFNYEHEKKFMDIINNLIIIDDIEINIIGSWLWIKGNTFNIKDQLKKYGMRWSKNRKAWYLAPTTNNKRYGKNYRSNFKTFNDLKNYYGSKTIDKEKTKQLH